MTGVQTCALPILLLQVLPPRLWPRTGLGQQEAGWSLTRRLPMPPNRFLAWQAMEADPGDGDEEEERGTPTPASFTLPLATLEPASLAALALKFVLHDPGVTVAIASMHVTRFADENIAALSEPPLSPEIFEVLRRRHRWVHNFYNSKVM